MTHNLLAGRRVLVVEDEMLILMMVEDMLADMGCEAVTSAATVDQALACVKSQAFDVAVLDINLDGNKSYPVADALAALGTPFLFSTGYGDHSSGEGYRDQPMLHKPLQTRELVETFKALLSPQVRSDRGTPLNTI